MSDRRPSKLYVWEAPYPLNVATDANEFVESNFIREASPAHLIAVVRRGVESGTIKGERIVLDGASVGKDVPDDLIELVFYMEREKGVEWFRRGGDFILVPVVSDGGSET